MTGNGKVFISHAYQDTDACRPLLATLDSWDLTYWFQAERSEVDERLSPQVEQALAEADVFLRVLSAAARGSFWVQLETETFQRLRRDEQANRPEIGADDSTDDSTDGSANTPQTDDRNGQDDLDDADEHDADEHDADEHDAERERQRILIDISLDGSVSSDPGEEVAHSIDMTRARGLLWRAQLQRALGLGEPGTETSEIPAVSPSEVLSLVRARAQSRPLLPTGDDEVVSVALADRSADAGSARRTSYLVMLQGNNPGRIYPLQNDRMTLGRSRDSDLFLEDLAVSRHHAALVRDTTGRFVLYDENSKNGTFVNGQSVTERVLEDGDSIRLGQCVLQFRRPRNND